MHSNCRGASAINWTLICGDENAGLTVFWPDSGLDTGPILLQKSTKVAENDTVTSIYTRFLYPAGIEAMVEAVELIAAGKAPRIPQPEEGASYEPHITTKPILAQLDWNKNQSQMHNFIRGNDAIPGAWVILNGKKVMLFSSKRYKKKSLPRNAKEIAVMEAPGGKVYVHPYGLLLPTSDGKFVSSLLSRSVYSPKRSTHKMTKILFQCLQLFFDSSHLTSYLTSSSPFLLEEELFH
ncbi:unnamed protein product [Gongylonema pulchrum]|uniref:Formyl transferase N-terminal domain-containing protein n=1 Tax=Gongylonema pulchrum TaxID=637853 RepID=A0A3P7MBZ8_9BILA|nr:unnamed protein product [Gongylonema pulchrum]